MAMGRGPGAAPAPAPAPALGPAPAAPALGSLYKDEPAPMGDPHRPHSHQPGAIPPHLQQSRPSSIVHQHHPSSPRQPSGAFVQSHPSNQSLPLQHQNSYHQTASGADGNSPEVPYYSQPSPYGTPVSAQYSSNEPPDLMAATQMQRPYQPVYHTPQSNSPASVASTQSHDPNSRLYGQPPPQLQQPMYGYPQYQQPSIQNYSAAYAQHPGQQQQPPPPPPPPQQQQQQQRAQPAQPHPPMTSQPQMMMPHQQQAQPPTQHTQAQSQASTMGTSSPRMKMEPQAIQQRPLDPSSLAQRPTPGPMNGNHIAPSGPQTNGQLHSGQSNGGVMGGGGGMNGVNPNAAPGPIPATTPLVVRQDENGVQWILFEYSRDRVKMEYTIRCDVESVNADSLTADFKSENCVYPRACCTKDQYRGNRLAYETECNTVGWALADLNPCLRGKRGLIQRAVDSWRNSNQDPRLRSRRVRRMAKIHTRKQVQAPAQPHPSHLPGPGAPGAATGVTPSPNPMAGPLVQRQQASGMNMPSSSSSSTSSSLHHHHAHPDGSVPGLKDEVSVNGTYPPQHTQHQMMAKQAAPNDIRQSQVFQGYPNFPPPASQGNVSIPPGYANGIDGPMPSRPTAHPSNPSSATAASAPTTVKMDDSNQEDWKERHATPSAHFNVLGDVPEAKRRKFISLDDPERGNRVRVRAFLDNVDTQQIPDSYRKANSVYPRSYFPIQMPLPKGPASRGDRFFRDDEDDGGSSHGEGDGDEEAVTGRTMVPVPLPDGAEGELAVPKIGRAKRKREEMLNDLGNRMSWTLGRVFADRTIILQRALDKYRNKKRTTITTGGRHSSTAARHLETRIGKRIWLARKGKATRKEEAGPSS